MSKVILGATLTSQADGKSSTNALGNVHNEVRHDLMASDAVQVASTLTRELLYPLLVLNGFGDITPRRMCRFKFDTSEPDDLTVTADAIDNAPDAIVDASAKAMSTLLTPLLAALSQGKTPDEARAALSDAYPQLNDDELRQLITQAVFAADIWGRLNAG